MKIEKNIYGTPWTKEDFEFTIQKGAFNFVLQKELETIGYFCSITTNKILHITNFAIAKKYQNKGIGTVFFRTIIELLIGYGYGFYFLEVRKSNKKAIRLYEKLGFGISDIIENYYKKPEEDAFIMVKIQ